MKNPITSVLEQTPGIMNTLLGTATEEQLEWQPSADRWSISMVLAHLADVEVRGFVSRFRAIATEESPFLPSYDQMALFASGARFDGTEELAKFTERRKQTLAFLASLPDGVDGRSGRHEELGVITFGELLNEFAFHDLGHIRQVAEIYRSCAYYPNMGGFKRYYKINP